MITTTLYILIATILILIFWIVSFEIRIRRFMRGSNGKSLEKSLSSLLQNTEKIKEENLILKEEINFLKIKQVKNIRNINTVRFNPFKDQGGNQSFATALINDEKDGVIISTLFARERMSVFAKPIVNGKSDYELTVEEKEVLEKSL
jgi:hypothetical protein